MRDYASISRYEERRLGAVREVELENLGGVENDAAKKLAQTMSRGTNATILSCGK